MYSLISFQNIKMYMLFSYIHNFSIHFSNIIISDNLHSRPAFIFGNQYFILLSKIKTNKGDKK